LTGCSVCPETTSSYVISRHDATFAPTTSSPLRPAGTRLLRWNLADVSGWLDGSTVRLAFTMENKRTSGPLVPIAVSPACIFRRMRIIASGSSVLEDIDFYGRTVQLMHEFQNPTRRFLQVGEEWGGSSTACTLSSPAAVDNIRANESRQLCCTLMSKILSQSKYLPLTMLPLQLELELSSDPDECFDGTGNDFELSRLRILGSVIQLDQALANSYAKLLLDGKSLPMYTDGIYSMVSSIPAGSTLFSLPISRGFTRLSAAFVTFMDAPGANKKWVNRFFNPTQGGDNNDATDNIQWYIQIGGDRWPDFDCSSHQESYYRLRQTTKAIMGTDLNSISPYQYLNNKYVIGHSFEKSSGAGSHSGINTRGGSQLTFHFRNLGAAVTAHVVLLFDQVVDISMAGVQVLD